MDDLARTEALRPGDACEFRFPARREWRAGMLVHHGGYGYWRVLDTETGEHVGGLHIEHVRASGTDPWSL